MQVNWSLVINVLLLVGVITAIGRLMKARKQSLSPERYQPTLGKVENSPYDLEPLNDDIIAVRKIIRDAPLASEPELPHDPLTITPKADKPSLLGQEEIKITAKEVRPKESCSNSGAHGKPDTTPTIMMFLLAKGNRQFAGYELLQTLLAAGLRFGEGHIFHRHQFTNGQGPVLCSLAAATATGVFDLQNIGAFSVHGLCLFMHASHNATIDAERFSIMLETARQLSDGLDAHLLDGQRKPLDEQRLARYYQVLHIDQEEKEYA